MLSHEEHPLAARSGGPGVALWSAQRDWLCAFALP